MEFHSNQSKFRRQISQAKIQVDVKFIFFQSFKNHQVNVKFDHLSHQATDISQIVFI